MPNAVDLQQELLRLVRPQSAETSMSTVTPGVSQQSGVTSDGENIGDLTRELESLRRQLGATEETARRQAEIFDQNTRAVLQSNSRPSSGATGTAGDVVSSVRSGGGLFTSPLGGLVNWLIGRRGQNAPEPELPALSLPDPIEANLGFAPSNGAGLNPAGYRADGLPRSIPEPSAAPATNITIQVQTMDSRSFLDNSDQIARAVREAMLNSHPINDVIGEM
jgi:hypothetical protein